MGSTSPLFYIPMPAHSFKEIARKRQMQKVGCIPDDSFPPNSSWIAAIVVVLGGLSYFLFKK